MRIGDIVGREVDIDYTSHNVPCTRRQMYVLIIILKLFVVYKL